jgi:transposase-like protein
MSILIDILQEKCPKCSQGKMFYKKGNPLLFQMPRMHERCPVCQHKFEKETGYFFGSMYVSYGLTVAEMVAVFVIVQFFTNSYLTVISIIAIMAVLLSTFNFRLSRVIWVYMLDGKDRNV